MANLVDASGRLVSLAARSLDDAPGTLIVDLAQFDNHALRVGMPARTRGEVLHIDEPRFARTNPDRWARDRQYLTHEPTAVIASFARWREESHALFSALAADAWTRGGVHLDGRGRRTLDEFLSVIAWHDDNHLDQLARALDGRP